MGTTATRQASRALAALLCVTFLALGAGTAWAGSTPIDPEEPYSDNGECLYCHQGGLAVSLVDFTVDTTVDRGSACIKCHWEPAGSHPYHNIGWQCGACHRTEMGYSNPAAIPSVPTTYGYFNTYGSAETDSRTLHIIHSNPTWAGTMSKNGRQCSSCHAAAACTACHEDPDVTHSEHAWDVGTGAYWPGCEPSGRSFGAGTAQGNEYERSISSALTCSNTTCHMSASGADAPWLIEDYSSEVAYTGAWIRSGISGYTANSIFRSNQAGAEAQVTFTGRKVELISAKDKYNGLVRVYLDGEEVATIDLYAATLTKQYVAYSSGELSSGPHTLTIEVTGERNPLSRESYVTLDALRVYPVSTLSLTACTTCHSPDTFTGEEKDRTSSHANPLAHIATETAGAILTTSTVRPSVGCTSACHLDRIDLEHASVIATASPAKLADGALSCVECHTDAKFVPFAAPGIGDWGKTCAECHTLRHDAYPAKHDFTATSRNTCGLEESCHNVANVDRIHHNAQSEDANNCNVCHTSDAKPAGTQNGGAPANECTDCHDGSSHGSVGSHRIHTNASDPRGPGGLVCSDCHDTGAYPRFKTGTDGDSDGRYDLSETDVCDPCHSPGGSYDGVDSAVAPSGGMSVGAKTNWESQVYESTSTLRAGKERWCAGCHDGDASVPGEAPSLIDGVYAPPVAGDESSATPYGTGFGYYVTGHGRSAGLYPASLAPAANVGCASCHDFAGSHIDGSSRTYAAGSDNYQTGYRLASVGGGSPMDIPRIEWEMPASDFALCFKSGCHDSDLYLNSGNATTNFRSGSTNSHYTHLAYGGAWTDHWDSDWNGTGDSQDSCPACHNVHGSRTPAMTQDAWLTGAGPGLMFKYTGSGPAYPTRPESTGGQTVLPPGGGTIGTNGICVMCHNQQGSYARTPNDFYPPRITSAWGRPGSDLVAVTFSKPVYTDVGASGAVTAGDFLLEDADDGRTIVGSNHVAGADDAQLTLSSPFDASGDLGSDTLRAASATSVYDAGSLAMETATVTILGDTVAPSGSGLGPANGAIGVSVASNLTLTLSDGASGVDWSTFQIQLVGDKGYAKTYTDSDVSIVTKSGDPSFYLVSVDPDANFALSEVVTVTVSVSDRCGNALTAPTWSFTAEATAAPLTTTVYPSGLATNPGGYWTVPTTEQWDTYLDVNDGDMLYATSNTGAAGARLHLAMDDPDLTGATIQEVKLHAYGRYVSGWAPSPPAATGSVRIGYTTGGATQWTSDISLPGDGNYIHAETATFTLDAGGGGLDSSDIQNLWIGVERRTGGAAPMRITQVYAVVKYVP